MINILKNKSLVENGDKVVITHGDGKFFRKGTSNSLRVEIIKDLPKEESKSRGEDKFQEVPIDKGRIILDTSLCASCQSCISVCPHNIWKLSDDNEKNTMIDVMNAKACSKDMECVEQCPTGAIEILSTDL